MIFHSYDSFNMYLFQLYTCIHWYAHYQKKTSPLSQVVRIRRFFGIARLSEIPWYSHDFLLFGFNQGIFYDKNQKGRTPGKFSLDVRSCSNLATQSLDIQLYIHFLAQMLLLKSQFVDYTMLYPDVSSTLICFYLHFPHLLAEDEVPKDHILQQSG